ncbi:hypothetical protein AB0J40_19350 [Amycolatopsis sp. NPDC049691]|uniref:hypothetical protein n=1 Tax=Amycolatopsis sp. NPDC049691 TaxID=3155155 RepID=UPI0034392708
MTQGRPGRQPEVRPAGERQAHLQRTAKRVARARLLWAGGVLFAARYLPIPRKIAVVLAARHLVQAAAALRRPAGLVARFGWSADAAHSASMLVWAAVSRRWRAAALTNAAVAAAWARAARPKHRRVGTPPETTTHS